MTTTAELIDRLRRHYDDGCFACGRDNPLGLNMDDFDFEDGVVSASFNPRPDFRGVQGILHGGVAATALDEILVWAGILNEKVMSVTGTMEMKFRKPVHIADTITVRARIDERRGRRLIASGELVVDDQVRVQASGLYLVSADLAEMGVF
ncbi:MAG: PaaI family thioesterase [Actinomycetota bacterium]|nr:PaaI family thioesterase [Actinomycetota bacterium]